MLNERMVALGTQRSVIRELFEFGKIRAAEVGAENVFDFSIGNPSVPAPDCVNETAIRMLQDLDPVLLHGYTSAQGDAIVRKQVADNLNLRFATSYRPENLYMTVGAAASLCCGCGLYPQAVELPGDDHHRELAAAGFGADRRRLVAVQHLYNPAGAVLRKNGLHCCGSSPADPVPGDVQKHHH